MSLIASNTPFKHWHPFEITGAGLWGMERSERMGVLLCSLYAEWKCPFILTVVITMLLPRPINPTGAAEPSPTPSPTDPVSKPTNPGPDPTEPTSSNPPKAASAFPVAAETTTRGTSSTSDLAG